MKQNNYSVRLYWDTRAMDAKTNLSRIMLTINLPDCHQFRITLKVRSTKPEFDKAIDATSKNLSEEAHSVRKDLNDYLLKAETILERLHNPSQEMFTRMFKSETDLYVNNKTPIEFYFKIKISRLFSEERFTSSLAYRAALSSLLSYQKELNFEDIDERFLKGFIQARLQKGNSISTSQMYLRCLCAVFNEVIREGVIAERFFPFKKFKFKPTMKSVSVLYPIQLKELLNYKTKGVMDRHGIDRDRRALDFFFFCYTGNGMNFHDAGLLKYKNVQGDYLTFVRQKTKKTGKEIKLYLHDLTRDIIEKWGNKNASPDDYLFGLVNDKMSAFDRKKVLDAYKKLSNQSLSKIGKELGFGVHLCLGLARHSYATKMKLDGCPVSFISDAMGHTTTNTTEHYLKSLPNENLKIMSSNLLTF